MEEIIDGVFQAGARALSYHGLGFGFESEEKNLLKTLDLDLDFDLGLDTKREIFKEREQKMVEEMTFQSRKYNDLLEQSFYMVGSIEKVIAKAKKISKEFNVA
ncbi:hypothetical protein Peur_011581 [Populus x canadensis]